MFRPLETVLHLPAPPSVNKTRRIDWRNKPAHDRWVAKAGMAVMAAGGMRKFKAMPDRFEVHIVVDPRTGLDLDNAAKSVIDFAKEVGMIINDSQRYMVGVHITSGHAPDGCTLTLRSIP